MEEGILEVYFKWLSSELHEMNFIIQALLSAGCGFLGGFELDPIKDHFGMFPREQPV
jgi:hypothetical protein